MHQRIFKKLSEKQCINGRSNFHIDDEELDMEKFQDAFCFPKLNTGEALEVMLHLTAWFLFNRTFKFLYADGNATHH